MAEEQNKKSNISKKQAIIVSAVILLLSAMIVGFLVFKASKTKTDIEGIDEVVYENPEDVLVFPGVDAPGEQIRKHIDLVFDNAAHASTIELADCKPNPLVARIPLGSDLVFKNTDDTARSLRWPHEVKDGKGEFEVPAQGENFITIDFIDAETMGDVVTVGYFCGPSLEPAGIILIEGGVALP